VEASTPIAMSGLTGRIIPGSSLRLLQVPIYAEALSKASALQTRAI
jgi:hypothetical protein